MDIFQILVLALYLPQVLSKSRSKKYKSSSSDEDSIENLLYYKDCQRQGKPETTAAPVQLRYEPPPPPPPPRQPECPFPKMCCALTCGNECGNSQPAYVNRQMERMSSFPSIQPIQPIPQPRQPGMGAVQPQIIQRRKKKMKFPPNKMEVPLQTRRDFSGFTKEKIKGLIAQDNDIRKILKDLVRVTMQKVDLLDMLNTNTENSPKIEDNANMMSSPSPVVSLDEYDE